MLMTSPSPATVEVPSSLQKQENFRIFFFWAIVLLAFALRMTGIRWGLPGGEHLVSSYRPDEYSLFAWLRRMDPGQMDFNPHIYFNGTFLLFVLAGFYKALSLLGMITVSSSPAFYYQHPEELGKIFLSGRMLMVFFGTASVAILYQAGKEAFGKRAGLIAALLLAITPLHVVSSKHMLVEPAAVLWFTLACLYALRIVRNAGTRDYVLAGIVTGSACAVKINCAPWGFLLVFAHLLRERNGQSWMARLKDRRLWLAAGAATGTYLISNPFLLFNFQEALAELLMWRMQYTDAWKGLGYGLPFSLTHLLPAGLGMPFFLWALAACVWGIFSKQGTARFLAWSALLFFYLHARTGTVIVKYHILLLPFLSLLSAAFLESLLERFSGPVRVLVISVFAFGVLQATALSMTYNKIFSEPDARDRASAWIRENIPAGAKIAVYKTPYDHSPPAIYNEFYFTGKSPEWRTDSRYKLLVLEEELSRLAPSGADYAVFSVPENRLFRKQAGNFAKDDSWTFLEQALNAAGYQRTEVFSAPAEKAIDRRFPPADWLQILPEIRIYQKAHAGGRNL